MNFNTGFSSTRSDVLVHLAQWQYWWWFWFSFLWSFYFLVFLRVFRFRTLKMRPKIVTSFRPHGKWGDFLAAIIPALWCLNILTNSNFILRLVEWQSESSLFTVRIRARQWYWIYKYELKVATDILSVPKNIGSNKWVFSFFGELEVSDDYLHLLQLRRNSKWVSDYWNSIEQKIDDTKIYSQPVSTLFESYKSADSSYVSWLDHLDLFSHTQPYKNIVTNYNLFFLVFENSTQQNNFIEDICDNDLFILNNFNVVTPGILSYENQFEFAPDSTNKISNQFQYNNIIGVLASLDETLLNYLLQKDTVTNAFRLGNNFLNDGLMYYLFGFDVDSDSLKTFFDNNELSRFVKKSKGVIYPYKLVKTDLLSPDVNQLHNSKFELFKHFWGSGLSTIEQKDYSNAHYLVLKQKKYSRKDSIRSLNGSLNSFSVLHNNEIFEQYVDNPNTTYNLVKKNKKRHELVPTTLSKRLLRVKRTLVLPAQINITLITNSFDIVHSWFIPGLGVKMDCVPGRSTHHTFFIDSVGFYFGQCAEICGRYHHHMPIRVCALPFEHFALWWQLFGMSKLSSIDKSYKYSQSYSAFKYLW